MIVSPLVAALVVTVAAVALGIVNISNVISGSKNRQGIERRAEVSPPSSEAGPAIILVGVATFALAIFTGLYVGLAVLGLQETYPLGMLQIPQPEAVRAFGVTFFAAGSALFSWSVLARGRYSVSWAMPVDQKLVTWGPYKYIRHPSYSGYFLMFIGLFMAWSNLLAVMLLLGIPGYVRISQKEERMLVLRFGDAYVEYQKKTGRFLPQLRR
jgi:protein-S-isoprenylcysteine O-methyltransferase Ste14